MKDSLPGYLIWINVIYRLILQNPECFPADEAVSPRLHEYIVEDWFRAYSLIRYHYRLVSIASNSKAKASTRRPMNLAAEVPKFLVDSDYQASAIDGDRDRLTAVTLDDVSSDEEYDGDEAREAEIADVQDQIEAVYEQAAIA